MSWCLTTTLPSGQLDLGGYLITVFLFDLELICLLRHFKRFWISRHSTNCFVLRLYLFIDFIPLDGML